MTAERIELAGRLLAEGKGKAETARLVGVSPATLWRAMNA